jgi:hypothetical protein
MGSTLFGPDGNPIKAKQFKRADPPKLGEAFGPVHSTSDLIYHTLPGGGPIQFNLDRLTLADFRTMLDHYQVSASMSVLTFMLHQMDWRIESDNAKVATHCEDNMREIWTSLVRSMSQAFWAGFSPNVLQWENDISGKTIQLAKIKDLMPEECMVNWKSVDGWAPPGSPKPKIKVYDGIKQLGATYPIPTENSFWYPLLMQNGNWYGSKLLRKAFTPWFFSNLVHLFSNRYYERFGEPLPVGRAPYDDTLDVGGKQVPGRDVMLGILQNLRSRGAVVLPSEKSTVGNDTSYDYGIEYLESQMRGADFERYLTRLDEEISLGLFTPLLMLRTADVGSYNLGNTHSHVYMQMLNALSGDMKTYIDKYILDRMVNFNFSATSARARIIFRKLGDDKVQMVTAVLQQLMSGGKVMPDLKEMSDIAGITLNEVKEEKVEQDPNPNPGATDPSGTPPGDSGNNQNGSGSGSSQNSGTAAEAMFRRVEAQFRKAYDNASLGNGFVPDLGYRRQYEDARVAAGSSVDEARHSYAVLAATVADLGSVPANSFSGPEEIVGYVRRVIVGD